VSRATATPEARAGEYRRAGAEEGFFGRISGYLAALATYLRARLQLAGLEAKEAMVHYAIIAGLLVGTLVVAVFGYFFLVLFAVFGLAWLIGGEHTWIWVTLGAAVAHFAIAAGLIFAARSKFTAPMFTATLAEFKKDNQWLTTTTARPS
jgi:uncharacterized membrane protein YqjE